jgi:hypothetical protein
VSGAGSRLRKLRLSLSDAYSASQGVVEKFGERIYINGLAHSHEANPPDLRRFCGQPETSRETIDFVEPDRLVGCARKLR